ncbi:hypothetical protein pah_c026o120 [Parachlamydia acanthamoebae str. Hall's coccus]|nr:hypothetical protein pah_c026o120 [Parachlamydia acanthamoebae str. Hall's coccus]
MNKNKPSYILYFPYPCDSCIHKQGVLLSPFKIVLSILVRP